MQLLGLLGGLAAGEPMGNPNPLMLLHERYVAECPSMFTEHVAIKLAIKTAKRNAKAVGHEDLAETLDALLHHAKIEEEALYPCRASGRVDNAGLAEVGIPSHIGQTTRRGPVSDPLAGQLTSLWTKEAISSVSGKLKIKHEEIDGILTEVEEQANKGKVKVAVSLLSTISPLILRSALEEEEKLMREVVQRHRDASQDSVAVIESAGQSRTF